MRLETLEIPALLDLGRTIARGLFDGLTYPWEALPRIREYILALGPTLNLAEFGQRAPGVWVHKTATVSPTAYIDGPCVVDAGAEIRHCAFIRGSAIVGKHAVVGNSTELKNCVLFDMVQVPHFNYVGDSILGFKAHMGAGAIASNVRSDKALVRVRADSEAIETGLKKFGAILGDNVEVGCNSVLNPGTIVGRGASVYPTSCVRGCVPEDSIFKNTGVVASREGVAP